MAQLTGSAWFTFLKASRLLELHLPAQRRRVALLKLSSSWAAGSSRLLLGYAHVPIDPISHGTCLYPLWTLLLVPSHWLHFERSLFRRFRLLSHQNVYYSLLGRSSYTRHCSWLALSRISALDQELRYAGWDFELLDWGSRWTCNVHSRFSSISSACLSLQRANDRTPWCKARHRRSTSLPSDRSIRGLWSARAPRSTATHRRLLASHLIYTCWRDRSQSFWDSAAGQGEDSPAWRPCGQSQASSGKSMQIWAARKVCRPPPLSAYSWKWWRRKVPHCNNSP